MTEVTPSGSGGPVQVRGPGEAGSLEIRGGVGGISFQFEELMGGAEKLDGLADELSAVEVEARRVWEDLCPYQNDQRSSGTAAVMAVGEAQRSVQAVRLELQRISSQVRASKRGYELAEAASGLARSVGISSPGDLVTSWVDFWRTGVPSESAMELVTANAPLTLSALLGLSPHHFGDLMRAEAQAGRDLTAVGPLVKSLAEGPLPVAKPRPIWVKREETSRVDFEASPAGLLERIRLIDERGDGSIEVIEVEHGGHKAYVVVIPGTQPAAEIGGSNPFDEAGIAEGLGYSSIEVNTAVREALKAVGAEQGAPVVAVGYSQGGIHAMNLAADKLFLDEYDVKYVLTAGSPVGAIAPAAGITTLHLEHRADWVPGGDGAPSPDTRNRVTVTMNNPVWTEYGVAPGMGPGHAITNYQDGARLVGASDDPSLVDSTAVLSGVLGVGGAVTATRFTLSRANAPEPPATGRISGRGRPGPFPQQGK
ncbi:hypothetical protein J7E83_16150 [Arthrobacter sp. ISL-48]|uniref:PE-PPE domain-containing protein n=1 Tax=Arthrobacter sp. ISL-48 TaxID=2819110 RepID=UPI001BE4FBCE|nr:PE-PPE domain-containing protein [Arthrobacter sp. ISL-48]MBT2533626.1 hypothetical protein [Arthrobacter sp. ISL-48]